MNNISQFKILAAILILLQVGPLQAKEVTKKVMITEKVYLHNSGQGYMLPGREFMMNPVAKRKKLETLQRPYVVLESKSKFQGFLPNHKKRKTK